MRHILLSLLLAISASAAVIHVPSGVATIQAAHNGTLNAGDTIVVNAATYTGDERVDWTKSGTFGNFINVVSSNGQARWKGADITDAHDVRFINFETRHTDQSSRASYFLVGTACSNIWITDNSIHDINREGIQTQGSTEVHHLVFRNNTIYWIGHPGDSNAVDTGISGGSNCHHWLVEYSGLSRCGDFIDLYGSNHVFRNLWLHDYADAYWTNTPPNLTHPDGFQPGSDGQEDKARNHVIERCLIGDIIQDNGHGMIFNNNFGFTDSNILVRGCAMYNIGSGAIGSMGTPYIQVYDCVFDRMNYQASGGVVCNWFRQAPNWGSTNGLLINCIFSSMNSTSPPNSAITVETDNYVTVTNHLGYNSGSQPSFASTADPQFVNINALDYRVQSGSPARGLARYEGIGIITNGSGSGTSFGMPQRHTIFDGWGLVEGDQITTGGTTVRVTAINMATLVVTVSASVTWTNGQPVYWGPRGAQRDVGCMPFGAVPLTAAIITNLSTTYYVVPTGDARGAWFYTNGIPAVWVYDLVGGRFSATIANSGTVTAYAYAMYLQQSPVILAGQPVGGGGGAPPPTNILFRLLKIFRKR